MSTKTITWQHKVNGVLTSLTDVPKLSDPTAAYGVKNTATGAVIVADGQSMTLSVAGIYTYTPLNIAATEITWAGAGGANGTLAYGQQYTYYIEYEEYGGTVRAPYTFTVEADSSAATDGSVSWVIDELVTYTNATRTKCLGWAQTAYDTFLMGRHPRTGMRHAWSFLIVPYEMTIGASVEGTASGTYAAGVSGLAIGSIEVTATTDIFDSTHVGRYLTVENVGNYRITAYDTETGIITVEVLTGQMAANFTSQSVWVDGTFDLPADFGGLASKKIVYMRNSSDTVYDITSASPHEIKEDWRDSITASAPCKYAIVPRPLATATGQRWQMLVSPLSDSARVWNFSYHVLPPRLQDSTSVFFLGGAQHYETIKALALEAAERGAYNKIAEKAQFAAVAMESSIQVDAEMFKTYSAKSIQGDDGMSENGSLDFADFMT